MTDYSALIERIEKGSGQDLELAYDIALLCGYSSPPIPSHKYKSDIICSLDAALAFAEAVLPGWPRHLMEADDGADWTATVLQPEWPRKSDRPFYETEHTDAPRAVLLATLHALQAKATP